MTENEITLLNLIHDYKYPEQALCTAIETTLLYLAQLESFAEPVVVDSQAHA